MRWRGGLGSFLLRRCSLTSCFFSSCSCRLRLCTAPLFLPWKLSLCSFRFGYHSVPSFAMSAAGLRSCGCGRCEVPRQGFVFSFFCGPPRVPRACLLGSSLTPPRTASGHNAPFQILQNPNVAAMRWRGGLGSSSLRNCSLTPCNLST